jgi:hypothetical protein
MLQTSIHTTPAERVMARLVAEGWVDCSDLGFPALCQYALPDLQEFVLERLRKNRRQREIDLQLATLVFSIPAHEFQFHPRLKAVLSQLEAQGMIEIHQAELPNGKPAKFNRRIVLKTTQVA